MVFGGQYDPANQGQRHWLFQTAAHYFGKYGNKY
jgi:hypothetical protein